MPLGGELDKKTPPSGAAFGRLILLVFRAHADPPGPSHMTKKRSDRGEPAVIQAPGPDERDEPHAGAAFPIVGIGASAGGLEAFSELLAHLPVDTGMAFVLVQHLDPLHESALSQLLSRATVMPVREVTNDLRVEANHVYVIPPNTKLSISAGVLKLQPREKGRTPLRSIDFFLESLAEDHHERAVGIILSGTATDGTLGLEAIKAEGGITFAQDESAKYDSMPRSAASAGCVDFVLSPEAIAFELARLAKHPYIAGAPTEALTRPEADHDYATAHQDDATPLPSGGSGEPDVGAERARTEAAHGQGKDGNENGNESGFKRVLTLLRNHCGVDFTLYKSNTIQRRIARRMLLCRSDTLAEYAQFLHGNAKELDSLFTDVLISVTSFFRNPDAFEALQREVLPKLLAQRGDEALRVWVLGCSTGQEAYSIAMAFVEVAEKEPSGRKLQVFATDLNDALLDKARHGLYAKSLAADLSPERLRRFFVEEGGGYRVAKPLREMVVFARQNLISDPPFSRIDIITCRNLLIYLEPSLQKKVFPVFHYALKPNGFLWLGASESIGGFTGLFEPLDRKQKIYIKKAATTPAFVLPVGYQRGERDSPGPVRRVASALQIGAGAEVDGFRAERNAQREADRVTVNQFAPPGVLINAERQIMQFRGITSAYLEPPTGAASFDVLKMAREGLMLPLRAAITKAARDDTTVRKEGIRIERDGKMRTANLEVIPLKNLRERCYLVLFEDAEKPARPDPAVAGEVAPDVAPPQAGRSEDKRRIAELENELVETREYLQSIRESFEASSEELQAANEEAQSANEELQSLNEELTTSKEELESSNEELTTLNDEMGHRNAELNVLGSDLLNVQTSAKLVTVLLGRDLRIRRFSAQAEKQFNLLDADRGRPIGNVRHRLQVTDLEALITAVIDTVRAEEREVQDQDGRWFSLRIRPYVTLDNKVEGAVLVLVDIDTLKRNERALYESEAQHRAIFAVTSVGMCEAEPATGRLLRVNGQYARLLGYSMAEVVGKTFVELTHPDDRAASWEGFSRMVRGEAVDYQMDKRMVRKDGAIIWIHVTCNMVRDGDGVPLRAVAVILDITDRRQAQEVAAHLAAIVTSSDDAIFSKDLQGVIRSWNKGAERLFGYAASEVIGRSMSLLLPADRADEESAILERLRRGETVVFDETVRRRKDASFIDISLTVSPYRDVAGRVMGAASIARDITERKRGQDVLRDNELRLREMIDAMPAAVYTTDVQGMLTHFNPAAVELAGRTPLIGTDWCVSWKAYLADGSLLPQCESPMATMLQGGHPVRGVEVVLERPDGTRVWVRPYPAPLHDAQARVVGGINVLVDITESKIAEVALVEADRRKNEFLAMLAHELRNPLAPIRNALSILKHDVGAEHSNAAQAAPPAGEAGTPGFAPGNVVASAVQMMERQVGQMVRLVDDLLDVSRISLGKIELRLERVGLASVIHQVEQAARPLFESMGQHLTISLPTQPVVLNADPARLVQIIGNLLNNACKFTNPGGRIALTVEVRGGEAPSAVEPDAAALLAPTLPAEGEFQTRARSSAPQVVIRVSDSGIGIATEQLPQIFQMFMQVDSSLARSAGGLGIGLALVKDLVTLHGGTVAVHSAGIGHGSEFEVRLPIMVEALGAPLAPPAPIPTALTDSAALKILVVDDNCDSAESLSFLLQLEGHETHLVYDGLAAVAAAAKLQPDVVLLDIGLPGIDGFEAARRIRAHNGDKRLLLVALTGWGQDEDRRRTAQAGFDAHLVKPVEIDALMKLLAVRRRPQR